jgi:hypothetical protein
MSSEPFGQEPHHNICPKDREHVADQLPQPRRLPSGLSQGHRRVSVDGLAVATFFTVMATRAREEYLLDSGQLCVP